MSCGWPKSFQSDYVAEINCALTTTSSDSNDDVQITHFREERTSDAFNYIIKFKYTNTLHMHKDGSYINFNNWLHYFLIIFPYYSFNFILTHRYISYRGKVFSVHYPVNLQWSANSLTINCDNWHVRLPSTDRR